jgi:plastocyanin
MTTVPASVHAVAQTVTGVAVIGPTDPVLVDAAVPPLRAMASFSPLPPSSTCLTLPARDFSLLTAWSSSKESVVTVNFGVVDPISPGETNIHWRYNRLQGIPLQGDVELVVLAATGPADLNVTSAGIAGRVTSGTTIDCGSGGVACSETLNAGDPVTLTAVPEAGSRVKSWSAPCAGSNVSCTLRMVNNLSVTVTFEPTHVVVVSPSTAPKRFRPQNLDIAAGEIVTWVWQGDNFAVVGGSGGVADNRFCSPADNGCGAASPLPSGTVYRHRFDTAGSSYPYFDPTFFGGGMTGTITVH